MPRALSERALAIRTGVALLMANLRYWRYVAPEVRRELKRWSARAAQIGDRHLREVAIEKLQAEHFNAEVAATLATLVPEAHRSRTVEAIVAFEVLYDYLDGLTEEPTADDPLERGWSLYRAFTAVFDGATADRPATERVLCDDGGYLDELSATVGQAIASLPGKCVMGRAGRRSAERCAISQVRVHAAAQVGVAQLERWARGDMEPGGAIEWREHVAGSVASVLAVHALIAAGADHSITKDQAEALDSAYLSISAMSTMLDSLIDYERDVASGDPWLVRLYGGDIGVLGDRLVAVASEAVARTRLLPNGAHHMMTLMGVVAYYTSAAEARGELARPVVARLHRELRPSILPTLAVMRVWRLAKRVRRVLRRVTRSTE
jgi:tetraprenyl-beta-curcumene synthase